jgi:uncharacterized protein (DUF1800 family)
VKTVPRLSVFPLCGLPWQSQTVPKRPRILISIAFFTLLSGALGQTSPTPTPPPPLDSGPITEQDAARFLSQSSFGATDALIAQVQTQGFYSFLDQQFAAPPSSHVAFVDATEVNPLTVQQTTQAWWTYAISAPDQLRQRVAFALSEIFVVSSSGKNLGALPAAIPTYTDVLVNDAFGNFRDLLQDITLNPAMGKYLDMLQNDKANSKTGRRSNENYAREIMQLFSIGLCQLNLDGTVALDPNGLCVPTYNQDAVLGLAAVFTGWTFAQTGTPVWNGATANWRAPMINIGSHHSTDAKLILSNVLIPPVQTAQQDLATALDTIFNHPNVGPFFCKQLIQRLVTSNPSPGYVYRVASVFNDNGQGVRGDLGAVIRAILLDYDARGAAQSAAGMGHQREPILRLTALLRAFNASSPDGKFSLGSTYSPFLESPMQSPDVFNFFAPDFAVPGPIADAGLSSPEFFITTESAVTATANYLNNAIYHSLGPSSDRIALDLANEQRLAANPPQLVDHLSTLLMAGNMSSAMRDMLVDVVTKIPASNPIERARTAIYLVINSPEFVVDK